MNETMKQAILALAETNPELARELAKEVGETTASRKEHRALHGFRLGGDQAVRAFEQGNEADAVRWVASGLGHLRTVFDEPKIKKLVKQLQDELFSKFEDMAEMEFEMKHGR